MLCPDQRRERGRPSDGGLQHLASAIGISNQVMTLLEEECFDVNSLMLSSRRDLTEVRYDVRLAHVRKV